MKGLAFEAYESANKVLLTRCSAPTRQLAHIANHGAGWLEGGLTASYEKFVIDIEMLQMFAELFKPLNCEDLELGLDAMREVGHGGHFFGAAHTLERYQDAFYEPPVSDWQNHGAWIESGGEDAARRAHNIWKQALAEFEPPPMAEDTREDLDAFVKKRKTEGGAAPASQRRNQRVRRALRVFYHGGGGYYPRPYPEKGDFPFFL